MIDYSKKYSRVIGKKTLKGMVEGQFLVVVLDVTMGIPGGCIFDLINEDVWMFVEKEVTPCSLIETFDDFLKTFVARSIEKGFLHIKPECWLVEEN